MPSPSPTVRRRAHETYDRRKRAEKQARRAALLEAQGGLCAICKTPDDGQFHLDHDHRCCPRKTLYSCGECDRGMLCRYCNTNVVGAVESGLIPAAVLYLEGQ